MDIVLALLTHLTCLPSQSSSCRALSRRSMGLLLPCSSSWWLFHSWTSSIVKCIICSCDITCY